MRASHLFLAGTALGAVITLPAMAWSSHIKPGLWEMKMQSGQSVAMPDMSQMPPQIRAKMAAQMRAHGVQMNGNTITVRHCVTQAEANSDQPHMGQSKNCRVENVHTTGNSYSADMVCSGAINARGHTQITFESPVHYFGTSTMNGSAGGRPISSSTKVDARWLASDCGKVK
jgi:hypothetical protein